MSPEHGEPVPGRATLAGRVEVVGSKVLGRGEKNPSIRSVESGCCQPSVIERQLARGGGWWRPILCPENEWILQCSPPSPVEPKVIPPKSSSVAVNHAVAGDASVSVHAPGSGATDWGPPGEVGTFGRATRSSLVERSTSSQDRPRSRLRSKSKVVGTPCMSIGPAACETRIQAAFPWHPAIDTPAPSLLGSAPGGRTDDDSATFQLRPPVVLTSTS